ncbi:hypothetical protein ACFSYD_14320 [Paracoccus aerius]
MPEVIDHRPNRPQPQPQGDRVKRDPAPTRLQYRLERMWLRPIWRRTLRIGVPAFLVAMTAGLWLADEDRRALLSDGVQQVMHKVQSREEFQVRTMMVEGASPVVDKALRAMLPVELPASSFDIDLTALRLQVMQLDVIESVDLRIKPGASCRPWSRNANRRSCGAMPAGSRSWTRRVTASPRSPRATCAPTCR